MPEVRAAAGNSIALGDYEVFASTLKHMRLETSSLKRELEEMRSNLGPLTGANNCVHLLTVLREQQALVKRSVTPCLLRVQNIGYQYRESLYSLSFGLTSFAQQAGRMTPEQYDIRGPMHNQDNLHQDLYSGLIRLHVLHHASEGVVYGLWMMEELERHGYKLSPGTMYPLLHSLEKRGLLVSTEKRDGKRYRKLYRITPAGRKALLIAKEKVGELFGELFEHEHGRDRHRARSRR